MNYLMCSVGRRGELLKNFKSSLDQQSVLVATDNSPYAPALYFADKQYLVPKIDDCTYIDRLLDICREEKITVAMTFIDPEIEILAKNRRRFEELGVKVLVPQEETAHRCFDKYEMFQYLSSCGIPTVPTWASFEKFDVAYQEGVIEFPVFVKPRTGSGSVGARRIDTYKELISVMHQNNNLIVQKLMTGRDIDADVYIDIISGRAVSAFTKWKLETRIGGASKTVSFKDEMLFNFIQQVVSTMQFIGPIDMDFFYQDGKYYLSEVNPRFGGAYLHAYGAGVDFIKLIENNLRGIENAPVFGNYETGIVMMMYDSVVIQNMSDIL